MVEAYVRNGGEDLRSITTILRVTYFRSALRLILATNYLRFLGIVTRAFMVLTRRLTCERCSVCLYDTVLSDRDDLNGLCLCRYLE